MSRTGSFPIGCIVLNVIFLYQMTVEKGVFETLQRTIEVTTTNRRMQLLSIAFAFARSSSSIRFRNTRCRYRRHPDWGWVFRPWAARSLIANTHRSPTALWKTPIAGLASVTGLDPILQGAMVGRRQLRFFAHVPSWSIWTFAGLMR